MGGPNRDRWKAEDWRMAAPDVRRMLEEGWRVMSVCNRCQLSMWVDLPLVARVSGATTVLWNRHPPCRKIGCDGQVTFHGLPPSMGRSFKIRLVGEWPKRM